MIAFLEGEIRDVTLHDFVQVVVAVSGVGYLVLMPRNSASALQIGANQHIFTHQVVREDSLTLYGFLEKDEQDVFERLLSVSGIGPKIALAIVSALGASGVKEAVANDDLKALSSAPGLGKKGAQKIILELKGKLVSDTEASTAPAHPLSRILQDALTQLGYKPSLAKEATTKTLEQLPTNANDPGTALKIALALLAK